MLHIGPLTNKQIVRLYQNYFDGHFPDGVFQQGEERLTAISILKKMDSQDFFHFYFFFK